MRGATIIAVVGAAVTGIAVASCTVDHETSREVMEGSGAETMMAPALRKAPLVTGVDQDGREFSSRRLDGRVWVASFMFAACGDVCPALNLVQADLQREFADRGVRFVSMTTDPENDTPEVLKDYAGRYGARADVWWFVRMPVDSVRRLSVKGFALMDPEEPSMHSTRFILVDAEQQVRGFYDSADSTGIANLRRDISTLLTAPTSTRP